MPGGKFFVDTSVILYSLDTADPVKRERAHSWLGYLWRAGTGRLSWQVLNEVYVNGVLLSAASRPKAREVVRLFSRWNPVGVTDEIFERAWIWAEDEELSWWDSLILASAEHLECEVLLSEDFEAGRQYGSVRVVSPLETKPPPNMALRPRGALPPRVIA